MKAIVILVSAAGLSLAAFGVYQDQRQRDQRAFHQQLDQKHAAAMQAFKGQLQQQAAAFDQKARDVQRVHQQAKEQAEFEAEMLKLTPKP